MISEAIQPLQLIRQAAEIKFESNIEPLLVIWKSLRRLFQKVIEGLEGKINGQALGAALRQTVDTKRVTPNCLFISDEKFFDRLQCLKIFKLNCSGSFFERPFHVFQRSFRDVSHFFTQTPCFLIQNIFHLYC